MNNFNVFLKAIKCGDFENTVSILKDHSDYLLKDDEFGLKAIHWVCLLNRKKILKYILLKKCNIETRGKNGWRAIHFAALMGHKEIIKFLIENYCKIDSKTDNNETPLDVADGKSNHEFIDEIFDKTINLKIGLSMGLRCGPACTHNFCLTMLHDIEMGQNIGKGTFGKIYQIGDILNEKTFACKNMKNHKLFKKELKYNIMPFINDYLWPSMINHAKIVTYYGSIEIPNRMLLIMEHMHGGSIEDIISSNELLSETKILQYTKDILQGLAFLHRNNIIHRRVKPSHMLINARDECKLSISTFSRLLVHEDIEEEFNLKDILPGTLNFMAPEIINGENYNLPVDIWSLGCSLINMLTGFPPYNGFNEYEICFQIGTIKTIEFEMHGSISHELKILIYHMLNSNNMQRFTADKLLINSLFQRFPNINHIDHSDNAVSGNIFNFESERKSYNNLIKYALVNTNIGLSMKFKCLSGCDHKLCLSSITAMNFKEGEIIGSGGFGKVYKMTESHSNRDFAIKIFDFDKNDEIRYLENALSDINLSSEEIYETINSTGYREKSGAENNKTDNLFEISINQYRYKIKHPNIIKYFGALRNPEKIFIFMEFICGGSLRKRIVGNQCQPLREETIKLYTKQILEGIKFLHNSKIIHRDIKSDNILITKDEIIKIADFGSSSILRSTFNYKRGTELCGTPNYMAPEVIVGNNKYNHLADIWSVGATVIEMASGSPPYDKYETFAVLYKIGFEKKLEYPPNISIEMKEFLDLMIQANPEERKEAEILLNSNFLKQIHENV